MMFRKIMIIALNRSLNLQKPQKLQKKIEEKSYSVQGQAPVCAMRLVLHSCIASKRFFCYCSSGYSSTSLPMRSSRCRHYDVRSPSQYDISSPSQYDVRSPSQYDISSPSQYDVRSPSQFDVRSPSQYDVRNPSQYDIRNPSQYDVRTPSQYDVRNPSQSKSCQKCDRKCRKCFKTKRPSTVSNWEKYPSKIKSCLKDSEDIHQNHSTCCASCHCCSSQLETFSFCCPKACESCTYKQQYHQKTKECNCSNQKSAIDYCANRQKRDYFYSENSRHQDTFRENVKIKIYLADMFRCKGRPLKQLFQTL